MRLPRPPAFARFVVARPPLGGIDLTVMAGDVALVENARGGPHGRPVLVGRDFLPGAPHSGARLLLSPPHRLVHRAVVADHVGVVVDLSGNPGWVLRSSPGYLFEQGSQFRCQRIGEAAIVDSSSDERLDEPDGDVSVENVRPRRGRAL